MSTDEPCLWAMRTATCDTRPITLDGIDPVELAELLTFTADALGWRSADTIRADLAAHLRRWATRLHPSTAGQKGATSTASESPGGTT